MRRPGILVIVASAARTDAHPTLFLSKRAIAASVKKRYGASVEPVLRK